VVVQDELIFMDANDLRKQQQRQEEQIPTYINLSITLEPLIRIPLDNDEEHYAGFEDSELLEKGTMWANKVTSSFKGQHRIVKCFLEDIDGRSVYIPRFLCPIRLPDDVYRRDEKPNRAIERAARYVSLIPFIDDSHLFKDMPNLTCTAQEFLDLGAGDSEEHAMLLCNYFNFVDQDQGRQRGDKAGKDGKNYQSYIVYGEAIPEGVTWYVLRRDCDQNHVELWNPNTAEVYNFDNQEKPKGRPGAAGGAGAGSQDHSSRNIRYNDPVCTMKKVWCVIGQDNVWANVQKEEAPVLIKFDLDNPKDWKPFRDNTNKGMRAAQRTAASDAANQNSNNSVARYREFSHCQTNAPDLKY
jgi:coiled-coil and C2 domain-containing protein 2A